MKPLQLGCGALALLAGSITVALGDAGQERFFAGFDYVPAYPLRPLDSRSPDGGPSAQRIRDANPFVLYEIGRNLVRRSFTREEGAMHNAGRTNIPLYAAAPPGSAVARFRGDHAASCFSCHGLPPGQPGFGTIIRSTGPLGRRTPHLFGAGEVELIAQQIRRELFRRCGLAPQDHIPVAAAKAGCRLLASPLPGTAPVDFGDLQPDAHGVPQLNPTLKLWFVDRDGVRVEASSLDDPSVAGFDFSVNAFGWGRGTRALRSGGALPLGGEAATLREIISSAAHDHMGLASIEGTEAFQGSWISLAGARQFHAAQKPPPGGAKGPGLAAGDIDAIEHFLLHMPAPYLRTSAEASRGQVLFSRAGCATCHVPRWRIEAADGKNGDGGDRRFFRLQVRQGVSGPVGALVRTMEASAGKWHPLLGEAMVEGLYSDLKAWDIGPAFHEVRHDGSMQKEHRTAPLWGLGSQTAFGHAGQFGSLEEVIAAHGGAAARASAFYMRLKPADKRSVHAFLESLRLYDVQQIPSDLDGDKAIARQFKSCGVPVGRERFDARLLFECPLAWRTAGDGALVLDNAEAAFGLGPAR